jgi:hypothetical protein
MAKFGKYKDDGAVEREATECALTGNPVDFENSVREPVTGTPYFWRVIGHQYHRVTDEHRELLAQMAKTEPDAKWEPLDLKKLKTAEKVHVAPVVKAVKVSEVKE